MKKDKKFVFKMQKEKTKFSLEMKYLLINSNLCYLQFNKEEGCDNWN